ncbi:hypothetical protein Trydic_g23220 [Trypoxylus dichotomus]
MKYTYSKDDLAADLILKKFQSDGICYETEASEISKFYAGKNVFVTGGTGFLGKLVLEKLLRACPDVATVYMLVRPKKGKDAHTRVDEIFGEVIFQKLSKLQPKFRHKIVLVGGDVSLPGLGMSIEDRKMIIEKATIFIHSAATVKFQEKLHLAVDINIKGTREMLNLARECQRIDCFVHISTAFTHCYRKDIDEQVYDVVYDADKITQICNAVPQQMLEKITPDIIGQWPNTYVFTKAIAEDCVKKAVQQFPVCIVRPAIVIATYKEPIRSWIDNVYGATGIVVGSGVGILHVVNIKADANAEIVPADMVVNLVLAGSYKTAMERKTEVSLYNYTPSPQNPLTWETFMELNSNFGTATPPIRSMWIYSLMLITNRTLYKFYMTFLHLIPGYLMDLGLLVTGKKPQMVSVYKKIHKFGDTIQYFGTRNWTFRTKNTQKLFESLPEADKKLFFFDLSKLDWKDYFSTHCLGLRTYIVKDDLSTIPQAKARYFKLRVAHTILMVVFYGVLLRLVFWLLSFLFL